MRNNANRVVSEQLLPLFRSFGNYPLLIRALAGEVAAFRGGPGDFDKWRAQNREFDPTRLPLKNAKTHVLEYALHGLKPEHRQVLGTIAAFRMPATWDTLRALLVDTGRAALPRRPDSPSASTQTKDGAAQQRSPTGGTKKPCRDDRALDAILTELEDRGLVGWDKKANRYDLHPIVRGVVWAATNPDTRNATYSEFEGFFRSIPPMQDALVENLDDLTATLELFNALICLARYDDAWGVFQNRLSKTMHNRLSASRERIELLERLFPDGIAGAPCLRRKSQRAWARQSLAESYLQSGRPGVAVQILLKYLAEFPPSDSSRRKVAALHDCSDALSESGSLRKAEQMAREALLIQIRDGDAFWIGVALGYLGRTLSLRNAGESAWITLLRARRIFAHLKRTRSEGVASALLADIHLMNGLALEALNLSDAAWRLASDLRIERDFVRACRLQGVSALRLQQNDKALERLTTAATRARIVSFAEEELPALSALAELHRRKNEPSTSRELLNQVWDAAERGPYPLLHADALNVLAQIERDQGNREAAIAAATKAYTLAWCDGPPYAYHYGLTNARKHLQELGAPEPQLPPFDASKFEPMPDVELNPQDEFWVDPDKLDSGC